MRTLEFTHTIPKSREGTYYTIPFRVPENVEKITVSYSYDNPSKGLWGDLHPKNVVDIGLLDEKKQFLGWSGSAHASIFVGEYGSSNGYRSEPIQPGEWRISVGAYHICEAGATVRYRIEWEEKQERLLFGDLHIHSDASDGRFDARAIAAMAKKRKLDFIGLANHNNYAENFNLPRVNDLTFIPAVEWTHYRGHMNFFGVKNPFQNSFVANSLEEMRAVVSDARALGALVSVNHPKCHICPYLWGDDHAFDMIEVWNGPMRGVNLDAIAWWTGFLRAGRRIPIVGGSDYHRPHTPVRLGHPVTAVFAASRSAEDIVKALRSGHAFVTQCVNGPRLTMRAGSARLGDTAPLDFIGRLEIKAEKLGGAALILVTQHGEQRLRPDRNGTASVEAPTGTHGFAYLKASKGRGKFYRVCAITNPIYFDH